MKEIAKADVMTDLLRSSPEEAIEKEYESDEHFFESFQGKLLEGKIIRDFDKKVVAGLPMVLSDAVGAAKHCRSIHRRDRSGHLTYVSKTFLDRNALLPTNFRG